MSKVLNSFKEWKSVLDLQPHPEGGAFREVYRAPHDVTCHQRDVVRCASTGIYFLLGKNDFSAFHRIESDEMWHFYAGDPLRVVILHEDGSLESIVLGQDILAGQHLQAVVPARCWFAAHVCDGGAYSLVGCTVAPGFEFDDFELACAEQLVQQFPQHEAEIRALTRQ